MNNFQLLPATFDKAADLYALRESDRTGWDGRTWIANASWLIQILSARLRASEEHCAEIVRLARTRAEDQAGDCVIDLPIREGIHYEHLGRVLAEKQRLRDGIDD